MAHVVTLDMDALAGELSTGLLADLQEAGCEARVSPLEGPHVKTGYGRSPRGRREDFRQHAQGVFDGVVPEGVCCREPVEA